MPAITFDRFEIGIDRRKAINASDANRLWDAKNVYITSGWKIRKRPGLDLKWAFAGAGAAVGLFPYNGKQNTVSASAITHAGTSPAAVNWQLAVPAGENVPVKVHQAEVFNGFAYISVEWDQGTVRHYYLSGSAPHSPVADVNCPHHKSFTKAASKIFSPGVEVVRYSATNDPTDWTTPGDAGFLPTGLQASGSVDPVGVGRYRKSLAVFHNDSLQLWAVDPDPLLMALDEVLELGTTLHRGSNNVAGDLYLLTPFGFRSISTQQQTTAIEDIDVGSPIDELVAADILAGNVPDDSIGLYFRGGAQYWLIAPKASSTRVYVFSLSRVAKLSAWTYYDIGLVVDGAAELNGVMYLKSGTSLYEVSNTVKTDNGVNYPTLAQLPYLSFKKPGQRKFIIGMDLVMQGRADVSVMLNASDLTAEASLGEISGDTRPGGLVPVEVSATESGYKFVTNHDEDWQLDMASVYYENEGLT